jgi:hypothetical protein
MIFPRLAFVTLANNLMVLSIRSMLTEFFCKLLPAYLTTTRHKLMISPHGCWSLLFPW